MARKMKTMDGNHAAAHASVSYTHLVRNFDAAYGIYDHPDRAGFRPYEET